MRKFHSMVVIALAAVIMLGFTSEKATESKTSENAPGYLEAEFVKSIHSTSLLNQLSENFCNLFDKVETVHAQFSEINGYYYRVFGEKNGVATTQLLIINEEDFNNETYSYISFSKTETNEFTQYCHRPMQISSCSPFCIFYGSGGEECDLAICGIWTGTQCIPE